MSVCEFLVHPNRKPNDREINNNCTNVNISENISPSRIINHINNVKNEKNSRHRNIDSSSNISDISNMSNISNSSDMPESYFDIKKRLKNDENVSIEEMIELWQECTKIKMVIWRQCQSFVDNCWALHIAFMKQKNGKELNLEYCSYLTRILCNTFENKRKFGKLFQSLIRNSMVNHVSFETLITSCYNQDTGMFFFEFLIVFFLLLFWIFEFVCDEVTRFSAIFFAVC